MIITSIILTAPATYTADIDGTVWSNITPAHRFYADVQDAIAGGEPVTNPPVIDPLVAWRASAKALCSEPSGCGG